MNRHSGSLQNGRCILNSLPPTVGVLHNGYIQPSVLMVAEILTTVVVGVGAWGVVACMLGCIYRYVFLEAQGLLFLIFCLG